MAKRGAGEPVHRLTEGARAIHRESFEHAIRLGHPYMGSEHVLLSLAGADHPAAAVLRAHGVTPARVEERIRRLSGGGMFGDLDRNALAAVGIDVDAVCEQVTRSLGQDALSRAGRTALRERRVAWWDPRRSYVGPGMHRNGMFIPARPGVKQCMVYARREGEARNDAQLGVGHIALGMLAVTDGLAPPILAALCDVPPAELRAALAAEC